MFSKKIRRMLVGTLLSAVIGIGSPFVFAEETPIATPVYNCHEGDCCDCSSILSSAIKKIIERNRFATSYSVGNFLDDIREGVHEQIKNGTDYDFELAKFEMITFLENYLNTSKASTAKLTMYVKEDGKWITKNNVAWSPRTAVEAYINAYQEKYDGTHDRSTSLQQAANVWNNEIVPYIDFGKKFVTMDDIRDILKKMGIEGMEGKSLEQIMNHLGHTHNPYAGSGIVEPCNCSHACSVKMQTSIQDSVKAGTDVPGYDHYIEAKVTNSKLKGLMSDMIKLGVVNIGTSSDPFYIIGECVCRLGAEPIITPASVNATWGSSANAVQPEGITNISAQVDVDKKMKDVSIDVNIKSLLDEELAGKKVMKYTLADDTGIKVSVRVYKINGSVQSTIDPSNYTVSVSDSREPLSEGVTPVYDTVKVKFNDSSSAVPFYVESGTKYKVQCYIRSDLTEDTQYGKKTGETDLESNSYKSKLLGTKKDIEVKLRGKVRISEAKTIGGIYYPEGYDTVESEIKPLPDNPIQVEYIEIAKIN